MMVASFEFATATRIIFGADKLREVGPMAQGFGRRALVVIFKTADGVQRAEPLLTALLSAGVDYDTFSVAGEPTVELVRTGAQHAREQGSHVVISLGGGSVIDTGKAIAALVTNGGDPLDYVEVVGKGQAITKPSLPHIAIPTTAGTGAEVTRNAVLGATEHRVKVSMRSPLMLPCVAVVDPELTYDLPPAVTASTGLDALTQVIEPFVSSKANPLTDAICREGMQRAGRSLRRAFEQGNDAAAREDMCLASLFGGLALANAGLGAVHGFAAPLGGMFPGAPHGALCAALLPAVMEVNARAAERLRQAATLQRLEEVRRIVGDVAALVRDLQVPTLRTYGVRREDFPDIIEKAAVASSMKGNPVPLTGAELGEILARAW
jgi:alcohol dehydrogenase class IV